METVNLIVSCTDRKRATISKELRLRGVPKGLPRERLSAWWERVRHSSAPEVPAHDLYGGEHWTWSLKIAERTQTPRRRVRLWVVSAGYGLVPSDARLKPYSATFTSQVPDSVVKTLPSGWTRPEFLAAWWQGLAGYKGPVPGQARSACDLAQSDPEAAIVFVASPDYVKALSEDLAGAARHLSSSDRLVIISNGSRLRAGALAEHLVPVDERAKARVGGTMQGLNARVATELLGGLNGHAVDGALLRARYEQMVEHTSKPLKSKRPQVEDDEVVSFIQAELAKNPKARQTALLAEFRKSGKACEQGRFRRLYKQIERNGAA